MDSQQPPPRDAKFVREDRCGRPYFSQISMQCKKNCFRCLWKENKIDSSTFGKMIIYTGVVSIGLSLKLLIANILHCTKGA